MEYKYNAAKHRLHKIQPKVDDSLPFHSRYECEKSILCCLHIGDTLSTHVDVLKGEGPPVCVPCEALTVEHNFTDCRPAYLAIFVWKSAGSTDVCVYFSKYKEFLGSTEIQTHLVHCFGRKAFECHSVVGLQCVSVFENESLRTLQFAYKMNDRNIVLGYFSVWINWLCIRQKSGQKSENLDTGCLDTDRSTLGGGAHL